MPIGPDVIPFLPDEKAFQRLKEIVGIPSLLLEVRQLSPDIQAFSLESFHSLLNQFGPKANAFSQEGMLTRYITSDI